MKKTGSMMIALVSIFLLVLAGCGSGSTGAVPRAPPAPSGGGCGIGAPAEISQDVAASVDAVEQDSAL